MSYFDSDAQESHTLLITEIFADPTPSQGLPENEYIEIFNNTSELIELSDFRLFYNTSNVRIPAFRLEPNAYVILCRNGNGENFAQYGDVVELSKFSLLNSGTKLEIRKLTGEIIHSIAYEVGWYTPGKMEGYSLEIIDVDFPCVGLGNWASSIADIGGTPGSVNSVTAKNPDLNGPELLSYSFDDQVLKLNFNEKLFSTIEATDFTFSPAQELDSFAVSSDFFSISFYLKDKLPAGESVYFILNHIADCSQNVSDPIQLILSNVPIPKVGDIVISEILFDPFPGGEDFVEIKNISGTVLNLSGIKVFNRNSSGNLASQVDLFLNQNVVLLPDSILCITTNKTQLLQVYQYSNAEAIVQVPKLPALPNETGEIILMNQDGELLEEVIYTSNWHFTSIDDPEGVSLERIDDYEEGLNSNNWRSTSGVSGFATPGVQKGSNQELTSTSIFPSIITPDGDGLDEFLTFNFSGIEESKNVTIKIFDKNGAFIDEPISNLYVTPKSEYVWSPDNLGRKLPTGYYYAYLQLIGQNSNQQLKLPFVIAYRN